MRKGKTIDIWTSQQIQKLKYHYAKIKTLDLLCQKIGKSLNQIHYQAQRLGLKRNTHASTMLTDKDKCWIVKNFNKYTNQQMADHFGCNISTIRIVCHARKLFRQELEYWTGEQIQFLRDNYQRVGDIELAICFNLLWHKKKGWTLKHIEKKRMYLKLKRTREEITAVRQRNVDRDCFPGSWESGIRNPAPIGTIKRWRYIDHKTKHEGYTYWIRTAEGYRPLGRYVYEQHFGKMPEDTVIGFKDRNNTNFDPQNLEAISRSEHVMRNRRSYPELTNEIKLLKQLESKIRSLLKKQNEHNKQN